MGLAPSDDPSEETTPSCCIKFRSFLLTLASSLLSPKRRLIPGCLPDTLDFELAYHRQTILAYEMNGEPLPITHGAPLHLRVEPSPLEDSEVAVRPRVVGDYKNIG